MALITLRVLDGADRGRTFQALPAPVTIGREEGNGVQLNDERVSRYHLKIHEDQRQFVLTDLDSTNGTKVNGEDAQLRILRYGDIISVGRSVLLFGSRQEIAERLVSMQGTGPNGATMVPEELRKLSLAERKAYIARKQKERDEIQGQIKTLGEARTKFLAEARREQAEAGESSLDDAVIASVRKQAERKKYVFAE